MKIDPNLMARNEGHVKKLTAPVLPLLDEVSDAKIPKDRISSFSLRTNPADNDSLTFQVYVPHLYGTEPIRAAIKHWHTMKKVFTGMNITSGKQAIALVDGVTKDTAFTYFSNKVVEIAEQLLLDAQELRRQDRLTAGDSAAVAEIAALAIAQPDLTMLQIDEAFEAMITVMAPSRALEKARRYLRRNCRKPTGMTTRDYVARLEHINTKELTALPPFQRSNMLATSEMIDIILFGVPNVWEKEMAKQAFDPLSGTLEALVTFCEKLESAEEFDKVAKPGANHQSNKKSKSDYSKRNNGNKGELKYCSHHGKNTTHSTNECKVLKGKAGKPKSNYDSSPKNKTWNRKANDGKNKTKDELATFIKKTIQSTVRKELHSFSKKRKSDNENSSNDDDDQSLNNFEQEFKNVSFDDIENMKIDPDVEFDSDDFESCASDE